MLGGIGGKKRRGWQRMRWLDGITDSMDEFEWTPGVGDGQGGLACCDSWGRKESNTTEWLNWTELNLTDHLFGLSTGTWDVLEVGWYTWMNSATWIGSETREYSLYTVCNRHAVSTRALLFLFHLAFWQYFASHRLQGLMKWVEETTQIIMQFIINRQHIY